MGDELADIFAGLSVAAGVAAIFGAGVLVVAPGFARWLTDLIADFFNGPAEDFEGEPEDMYDWMCDFCGETQDDEDYRAEYNGEMMCGLCSRDDSRWA